LIVFTILSSTFLFALDNTIVADVQSPIVQRFGEAGKLAWLGVAFVLSGSATIITWYAGNGTTDFL
jgi:tryptophan-rich sensory protein